MIIHRVRAAAGDEALLPDFRHRLSQKLMTSKGEDGGPAGN